MTTIATDGVTIAADGRSTRGWEIVGRRERKIIVRGGLVFALGGCRGMMEPLISWWIDENSDPKKVPPCGDGEEGWCLLVMSKDGASFMTNKVPYPDAIDVPFATGNGREYARGAMMAGADPRRAVEIACECDAASGGEIQVVNIAEALGLQPALKLVAGGGGE